MKNRSIIDKKWYKRDKLHCLDASVMEFANGDKEWYKGDKLHRLDGPAIEFANGDKEWYKEGKLHRTDGPAIEYADGDKEYHISINETISLVFIPNKKSYISMPNEKIILPCSSTEEFFHFFNLNLYKIYLTFS